MTSLADHWSDGDWLPVGHHEVTITGAKVFKYHTGNPGVEFTVRDGQGRERGVSFPLVESILWKLAQFAAATGITQEEAKTYNPTVPDSHQQMVNRKLGVTVEQVPSRKDPTKVYSEVTGWWSIADGPPSETIKPAPAPEQSVGPGLDDSPF